MRRSSGPSSGMGMNGLLEEWCKWIHDFVTERNVAIKVNDDTDHYFKTKKGLRQGEPLSSILCNIVLYMFAVMIERATIDGQTEGVVTYLVDDGLSILQYANDTILFMSHDLGKVRSLKLILSTCSSNCLDSKLISIKVNCFVYKRTRLLSTPNFLGCEEGQFPQRYLGIQIHYRRLTNTKWKHVEESLQNRLSSWKGKLLSLGGRLILINPVLSNMVLYMISFFQLSKGSCIKWIVSDQISFGKRTARKINIDRLDEMWFANLKAKEA